MTNKVRLGDLLVRAGLIKDSDLRVVLAQQKQHGGRLGEHLVRVNLATEEQIARALAHQLGLTYNDLSKPPPPAVTALLPEKVAARLQALAVGVDPRTRQLAVAFSDPLDEDAVAEVARITGRPVTVQVTPANPLRRAIEHAYFGVEVRDEGTSEFQLVDIHGRGKTVKVGTHAAEDGDLPELGTSDFEAIHTGEAEPLDGALEHAPLTGSPARTAPRPTPPPARATPPPVRPAPPRKPAPPPVSETVPDAGEEALRTVWALADLLIERGYFTRADLLMSLRKK